MKQNKQLCLTPFLAYFPNYSITCYEHSLLETMRNRLVINNNEGKLHCVKRANNLNKPGWCDRVYSLVLSLEPNQGFCFCCAPNKTFSSMQYIFLRVSTLGNAHLPESYCDNLSCIVWSSCDWNGCAAKICLYSTYQRTWKNALFLGL